MVVSVLLVLSSRKNVEPYAHQDHSHSENDHPKDFVSKFHRPGTPWKDQIVTQITKYDRVLIYC